MALHLEAHILVQEVEARKKEIQKSKASLLKEDLEIIHSIIDFQWLKKFNKLTAR